MYKMRDKYCLQMNTLEEVYEEMKDHNYIKILINCSHDFDEFVKLFIYDCPDYIIESMSQKDLINFLMNIPEIKSAFHF